MGKKKKKLQLFGAAPASGDAHEQRIYLVYIDFPRLPPTDSTWIMWLCLQQRGEGSLKRLESPLKRREEEQNEENGQV